MLCRWMALGVQDDAASTKACVISGRMRTPREWNILEHGRFGSCLFICEFRCYKLLSLSQCKDPMVSSASQLGWLLHRPRCSLVLAVRSQYGLTRELVRVVQPTISANCAPGTVFIKTGPLHLRFSLSKFKLHLRHPTRPSHIIMQKQRRNLIIFRVELPADSNIKTGTRLPRRSAPSPHRGSPRAHLYLNKLTLLWRLYIPRDPPRFVVGHLCCEVLQTNSQLWRAYTYA